jgi:pimeloyl-ACP methyl ester carboxylesterase
MYQPRGAPGKKAGHASDRGRKAKPSVQEHNETAVLPAWPGRMVTAPSGQQVWLAESGKQGPGRELVLCLHGMTGDSTNWTDLMGELMPEFPVVAADLPGSGFSPPPRSRRGYSITALARTVAELIESLGVGPVHLMGNSMGGDVALRTAARRPDLVRTLTLISAALPDRRPHRQTIHFPVIAVPLLGGWLIRRFGNLPAENRIAGVIGACYYNPATIHPARLAASVAELKRRDGLGYDVAVIAGAARTLVAETLRPHRFSLWRDAERLSRPALVLFGAQDRLVSPDLTARAGHAFRDARVVVLPETGHLGQMEHPAVVASLFRAMAESARTPPDNGRTPGNAGQPDPVEA